MSENKKVNKNGNKNGNEEAYTKVAEIIFPMVMDCLDEVVPYEQKSEAEKLEMEEIVALAIETSLLVVEKLCPQMPFDRNKLGQVYALVAKGDFDGADEILLGEDEEED